MPKILIKQPNGLYCYFSTVVDAIVTYNMTPEDVAKEILRDAKRRAESEIEHCLPIDLSLADKWAEKDTKGTRFRNWKDIKELIDYEENPDQLEVVKECEKTEGDK